MKPEIDRRIPYSNELEAILLGTILLNNDIITYFHFLKASDFYHKVNSDIYSAMVALHEDGQGISPFTVPKYLTDLSVFEPVGGSQKYLAQIMAMGSRGRGFELTYANAIADMAARRELADYLEKKAAELAVENDKLQLFEHTEQLRDVIDSMKTGQPDLFIHSRRATEEIITALHDGAPFYSTGFSALDKAMDGGLYAGKSYGIAARKKVGKTSFAATISFNLNRQKVDHLFICGEMSAREIQQRILCRAANVYPSSFRNEYGKSTEFQNKMLTAMNNMPNHTFFQNAPGMTFSSLKQSCRLAVEKKKVKGIILDYWQLVGGKRNGQSTSEHLDEVAQWIADFSRKNDIFTLTMAQINQEGNTRGSEGIRLAFDQLYHLHREDLTQPQTWLEMLETRYTPWANIGDEIRPGFMLSEKGTWFEEFRL